MLYNLIKELHAQTSARKLKRRGSLYDLNVGEGERERSAENTQLTSASHNGIRYHKVHYSEAGIDPEETRSLWLHLFFKRTQGMCLNFHMWSVSPERSQGKGLLPH